jgi:hypothetical protein
LFITPLPLGLERSRRQRAESAAVAGGHTADFAAALAHRDGIPLITGDPDFRGIEDLVRIAWLDELRL